MTGGVAIAGLGLIGGSLARDLAAAGSAVTGVDPDRRSLDDALREGVIRRALRPGEPLPGDVDLVVLAAPVPAIIALLEGIGGAAEAAPEAPLPVVTDVGSTKRSVMAAAAKAGLAGRFVGGHPMAGDHRRGWAASRPGLFRGAAVWLCAGGAEAAAVERVSALWRSIGASPSLMDAAGHDRLLARASHVPQATASALAGALADAGVERSALGPGGLDSTRLAASDAGLWTGILLDNADQVLEGLAELSGRLDGLAAALRRRDADAVRRQLEEAAAWRRESG